MTPNELLCGVITYTAAILGIAACIGWLRALREQCRLNMWARHWKSRAFDVEDQLRRIERKRSETTRRGNLTKAANLRTLVATKTAELQEGLGR
jgi:hypothetical protein